MKTDLDKIGRAMGLISNWLRDMAPSHISVPPDPLEDRNNALRELVIAYLELHIRMALQERGKLPPIVASLDSTRVIRLLEAAAESHQKFLDFSS
jgi:hypothetical protein